MMAWIVVLLRSITLFIVTLLFIRIMGKRHPAKITPFGYVNYTVIAIIVALISTNVITNLALGLVALAVWIALPIVLNYLSARNQWIHDWVNGKETILIKQGKIMEENLSQMRETGADLMRALRTKGVFNVADVEFAVMESTGDLNVLLKSDKKPITAYDMGTKVSPQSEPQTVILDGNVLNEPLSTLGLNQEWLHQQLQSTGVSLDNVFLGQVDSSGDLYMDLFDDSLQIPQPKVKEMIYANIEKSHADLMTFAMEAEDPEVRSMYSKNADKLKQMMEKVEPYLLR